MVCTGFYGFVSVLRTAQMCFLEQLWVVFFEMSWELRVVPDLEIVVLNVFFVMKMHRFSDTDFVWETTFFHTFFVTFLCWYGEIKRFPGIKHHFCGINHHVPVFLWKIQVLRPGSSRLGCGSGMHSAAALGLGKWGEVWWGKLVDPGGSWKIAGHP